MVAPATAAATNSMPTNSRPLPRNTVANRRSSRSPIRSRSTPMNHRKAIPANGMRFRATATAVRRPGSASQAPAIPGWAGTETRSSTSAVIRSKPKMIPAIAAPWDVRSGPPGRSHPRRVTSSIIRCGRVAADPRPVRFVMLSRIPASTDATALTGMATCLRPHRWPSLSRTWVTFWSAGSTTNPSTCPMWPSTACTLSWRSTSISPSGTACSTTSGEPCRPHPMPGSAHAMALTST